jgi:hypothetical protein
MMMTAGVRQLALTTHVTASVGWLGAVFVFLGHAAIGLTSQDPQIVRGAYLVMEPAAWVGLLPLAIAALVSGIVQSLGTTWGLFRHYWVVFKLLITIGATAILLIYMDTFRQMAAVAADPRVDTSAVRNLSPALHAGLALAALLIATILGIYKPAGLTPFGRRALGRTDREAVSGSARWMYIAAVTAIVLMQLLIVGHLTGHGPGRH